MKIQNFLFIFILLLIVSCTDRGCDEDRIDLIMSNQTNHSIKCEVYFNNQIEGLYNIPIMDKFTINGETFFPFETADSAIVIYDNQFQITHYKTNQQNGGATRSIIDINNWVKQSVETNCLNKYEYKFTENDYNEASQ